MRNFFLLFLLLLSISCSQEDVDIIDKEGSGTLTPQTYRPLFHFSVPNNWMNDPNGMFYLNGTYHLFYQYYPEGTQWGPMHWGHTTSEDLFNWKDKPIALYPDEYGYIFSGSAVVDSHNTSGLKSNENDPIVAVYTNHQNITGQQVQSIAYSNDNGETWVKYINNPVLPNQGIRDFRDPKVFWHDDSSAWIMSIAAGDHIQFYRSPNLIDWELSSTFGKEKGAHGGVWECPDLFQLELNGKNYWVLLVSINPGGPNGGSSTQYFIGDFDGINFTTEQDEILWLDEGVDNYAGVTWSNIPDSDGRKLFIGWMSNWDYAGGTPTSNWRGSMTLPRELTIRETSSGIRLFSSPVEELQQYLNRAQSNEPIFREGVFEFTNNDIIRSGAYQLTFNVDLSIGTNLEIKLGNGLEDLSINYDNSNKQFVIDRSRSGRVDFSPMFSKKIKCDYDAVNQTIPLKFIVDKSSIEIFINEGEKSMTALFFPKYEYSNLKISTDNTMNAVDNVLLTPIEQSVKR
ncbi:MAG: glycoside hydrolase family 32 protein [Flavobacteriaceae bacterium]|jgi:fructan beta-fructosidase